MMQLLNNHPLPTILVVGSGYQRRDLIAIFGSLVHVRLLCTDVSASADVDLFCDAHELPFDDGSFDALITTAVLEHVLYPERVALELHRVLKEEGLLYSEIPFIQQVHEGAYDFSRFTLSGHRRLLKGFREIQSGMVAGPATALVWSIEHFIIAFSERRLVRLLLKTFTRYAFFWIKYFDFLLRDRVAALDGASCTYFFGSRSTRTTSDADIIVGYKGAGGPN
jgi:SAM-dependent methyltransferase